MGTFSVSIEVGDLEGRRYETLDALVDTGATYLVLPQPVMERLGVSVTERRVFQIADGREIEFDVGDVSLRMDGRSHPVLAVFGDEASPVLLGAVPLETFGLGIDPINQRLVSIPGLLTSKR